MRAWMTVAAVVGANVLWTAQETARAEAPEVKLASTWSTRTARNALYVSGATVGIAGAFGVNYERNVAERVSVRVGIGYQFSPEPQVDCFDVCAPARGEPHGLAGLAMANFLIGSVASDHGLELGIGASIIHNGRVDSFGLELTDDVYLLPSASISYRYQPRDGGLFFRAGLAWTYGFGLPVEVSIGATF